MKKLTLIVEKLDKGYHGRIDYKSNLIVEEANSIEQLKTKLKKVHKKFYPDDDNELVFEIKYDLSALFDQFHYLKISSVADRAGINASLLRQYVIGKKQASSIQALKIEKVLHELGKELQKAKVYGK